MQKRRDLFSVLFVFFILSAILLLLSRTGLFLSIRSLLETAVSPIEENIYPLGGFFRIFASSQKKLEEENRGLIQKLIDQQMLQKENSALRDQFQTTSVSSQSLMPVKIVASPNFLPGITTPENFVINKGSKDGVKTNQGIVYKNNLVGKVTKVSSNMSLVTLVTNKSFSLAARTLGTSALGVIKGKGNGEMVLDNVLLSEELKAGDQLVTYGDIDINGIGLPEDLVIGKIVSIDKKPSALFQTAKVESLLNFTKLSTVFIVIKN